MSATIETQLDERVDREWFVIAFCHETRERNPVEWSPFVSVSQEVNIEIGIRVSRGRNTTRNRLNNGTEKTAELNSVEETLEKRNGGRKAGRNKENKIAA